MDFCYVSVVDQLIFLTSREDSADKLEVERIYY